MELTVGTVDGEFHQPVEKPEEYLRGDFVRQAQLSLPIWPVVGCGY